MVDAIERSADDTGEKQAIAAVQDVGTETRNANKQRSRSMAYAEKDKEIEWISKEIAVLKDMGDEDGAKQAQARLLKVMRTPVHVEEIPSRSASQGGGDTPPVGGRKDTPEVRASATASSGTSAGEVPPVPTGSGLDTDAGIGENGKISLAPLCGGGSPCRGDSGEPITSTEEDVIDDHDNFDEGIIDVTV